MTEEMIPYPPAPPRLEDEDPELGRLIAWYSNLDPIQRKRMGGLDTIIADKTVGRNEPCVCGSGIKYKKCCGK